VPHKGYVELTKTATREIILVIHRTEETARRKSQIGVLECRRNRRVCKSALKVDSHVAKKKGVDEDGVF
jgi:hypothetical protein